MTRQRQKQVIGHGSGFRQSLLLHRQFARKGDRNAHQQNVVMIDGEGRKRRAVNDLQRRSAEHIQRALGRCGVRFDIGQTHAAQAVCHWAVGHHVGIQVETDMEPERRSAIGLAVEGDIPAHLFEQFLGDHQP
ncbi:hypothetical protein D3C80_969430 [compost metagenome]